MRRQSGVKCCMGQKEGLREGNSERGQMERKTENPENGRRKGGKPAQPARRMSG
jgi:hypothetical protein